MKSCKCSCHKIKFLTSPDGTKKKANLKICSDCFMNHPQDKNFEIMKYGSSLSERFN